jgi:hypothetical protein
MPHYCARLHNTAVLRAADRDAARGQATRGQPGKRAPLKPARAERSSNATLAVVDLIVAAGGVYYRAWVVLSDREIFERARVWRAGGGVRD